MILKIKLFVVSIVAFLLVACGGSSNNSTSVFDVISDSENHTTLESVLEETGLDETLDDTDSTFTVFAPTDAAFDLLGDDTIAALLADTAALTDILLYHVIDGEIRAADLVASVGTTVETLNGASIAGGVDGGDTFVNFSLITQVNQLADNGVVHIIDAVLVPADLTASTSNIVETAVSDGRFTSLVAALQAAGLDATLSDESTSFTVFAPTDDAFAMLPAGTVTALLNDSAALEAILLQHVIAGAAVDSVTALSLNGMMAETASGAMIDIDVNFSGAMLSVGGANVSVTDIVTSNGIIHVIDSVIVGDVDVPQPSIVDVAEEIGGFTTLLTALEATGLDAVLADLDESFTVFAPTDDAFAALGQDTITDLLADTDTLSDILLYHVIQGQTILASSAISVAQGDSSTVETANGDDIALSLSGETLLINTAAVGPADVMAANGVIHVLDQVLLPPAEMGTPTLNIAETAVADSNFSTLVAALTAADLVGALSDETETYTVFAPTNAAFDLIPSETLTALLEDVPALTNVLLQHVIQGAAVDSVTAFTLNGTSQDTMAGEDVTIEIVDGVLEVQGSAVSTYDIYTTNGIIHVIDAVITETLE